MHGTAARLSRRYSRLAQQDSALAQAPEQFRRHRSACSLAGCQNEFEGQSISVDERVNLRF